MLNPTVAKIAGNAVKAAVGYAIISVIVKKK